MQIGFIGVGKITHAIVEGLCTSSIENVQIYLSPRNEANARHLAGKYTQVQRMESNQQVIDQSDIVFIALRPAVATEVLHALRFREEQMVVSLIPLLKETELLHAVAPATRITRAVPTPTVMQHSGPILLFHSNDTITQLFHHLGQPVEVSDEHQLHVLWTLTGLITPFYDLLHELHSWSVTNGVDTNTAQPYIAGLFQGLCLAAQQDRSINFKALAQHAETPNGMNEQAGREIREKGAHQAYRVAADHLLKRFE
ncbi:NAD(P)-binding domain-containing protein [Chitinophaga japonensis]|uniref:Pyrroline-5-carboxylate reductase n=1 Tax=Chitinophaga japonensis TaxID=104662 RepID=A0A562T3P2_CHIJA|nr:NAD(P)-binding domain-containing protein [Chitinophaga japonensis]TWI87918.1 pyrroline-5-carboxylate reductase [Chitinophaga japonensis]